jgi:glycosyltransferase involved in cell wall biosynthesis
MGKKILICCNAYPPNFIGGAELIAHSQAKELKNQGYDVTIFTGDLREWGKRHFLQGIREWGKRHFLQGIHEWGRRYFLRRIRKWGRRHLRREDYEGLPVYRVYLTNEDYAPQFVNFTHKEIEEHFRTILKNVSPDIVHFHNIIGLSVGLIHIAKKQGIKTVLTFHDHWGFCFKNTLLKNNNEICRDFTQCTGCMEVIPDHDNRDIPLRMRQDFIAMQLEEIDAFISPSQYLADTYILAGLPREKVHVIPNGIDVEKFSHIKKMPDPDHIRFTFIGHFGTHKGIHILLDALQYLDNKQKLSINLIGNGELFTHYYTEVHDKKSDIVKFWGRIENIEDAYAQTDVLILPSIWPENLPVSITEAMSAGIPVIASHVGGIPELVENGKTGFLFEPGDAWDLAIKMNEFTRHPDKIKNFGEAALQKIKNYGIRQQVQKIIKLYNQIPETRNEIAGAHAIIVCHGKHVDATCADTLKLFSKKFSVQKILFILSDWLDEDQLKSGTLFWIVDECEDLAAVHFGLRYKLPLLVPEKSQELKNFCEKVHCGLVYQNCRDAGCAILSILNNDKERVMMIKNGAKALREQGDGAIHTEDLETDQNTSSTTMRD